jgi:hypothetical protein
MTATNIIQALDPSHAMQFRPLLPPEVRAVRPA